MKLFEAQYGFDAFEMPDHELELKEEPMTLKCTITEGEFNSEWVEISDLKFSDEDAETGTGELTFKFDSSRGSVNDELKEFSEKLIQMVLIITMRQSEMVGSDEA